MFVYLSLILQELLVDPQTYSVHHSVKLSMTPYHSNTVRELEVRPFPTLVALASYCNLAPQGHLDWNTGLMLSEQTSQQWGQVDWNDSQQS